MLLLLKRFINVKNFDPEVIGVFLWFSGGLVLTFWGKSMKGIDFFDDV